MPSTCAVKRKHPPPDQTQEPSSNNARKLREHMIDNLTCSFFPKSFLEQNPGLTCSNCTNYFNQTQLEKKKQEEMGQKYKCVQLTSTNYFKPLKIIATIQRSTGGACLLPQPRKNHAHPQFPVLQPH